MDAIREIAAVHENPPRIVRRDSGQILWSTCLGELWAPQRADRDFMVMLSVETVLNVYRFSKADVVLDCGANIGIFTLKALQAGAVKILAFEPCAENAACYRRSFAQQIADGRVVLSENGLWDQPGELFLRNPPTANPGSPSFLPSSSPCEGTSVPVTTVDRAIAEHGLDRVDFIKMDIEGAEWNALRGSRDTLRRFQPRIGVGTEHTGDIFANNERVIETIRSIDSRYHYDVTESHPFKSPSRGWILTPYSLYFSVRSD
jgi:FkbM family methyltransferase